MSQGLKGRNLSTRGDSPGTAKATAVVKNEVIAPRLKPIRNPGDTGMTRAKPCHLRPERPHLYPG